MILTEEHNFVSIYIYTQLLSIYDWFLFMDIQIKVFTDSLSLSGQCPSFHYMSISISLISLPIFPFHTLPSWVSLKRWSRYSKSLIYLWHIQLKIQLSWFHKDYLHFTSSDDFELCEKYHAKLTFHVIKVHYEWFRFKVHQ